MPIRSASGTRPPRGRMPPSVSISAWIAFMAAFPYMPEWRSRSPVRTRRLNAARPRVATARAGSSRRSMLPSKMTHAVGAALVLAEKLDDRLPADLLLAVRDDAEVDRQRTVGGEQAGRVQQHPELALVVCDAARVEPLVPDRRLERVRLPELERRRRLHVEVAVGEDRRRARGAVRGRDLAHDERPLPVRDELGFAAAAADLLRDPLGGAHDVVRVRRVGAHGRDAQQLLELVQPGRIDRGHAASLVKPAGPDVPGASLAVRSRWNSTAVRAAGRSAASGARLRRRPAPPAGRRSRPGTSGDVAQLRGEGERAELLQALVLDLPDPLARHVERAADLVQRPRLLAVEAVAQLEHAPLAVRERVAGSCGAPRSASSPPPARPAAASSRR